MHIHAKVYLSFFVFYYHISVSLACVCNGYAKNCTFSQELYERTGHGSVCIDCTGNRGGPNCESCKLGFYRSPEDHGECLPCDCDVVGKFCL